MLALIGDACPKVTERNEIREAKGVHVVTVC